MTIRPAAEMAAISHPIRDANIASFNKSLERVFDNKEIGNYELENEYVDTWMDDLAVGIPQTAIIGGTETKIVLGLIGHISVEQTRAVARLKPLLESLGYTVACRNDNVSIKDGFETISRNYATMAISW